MSRVLPFVAVAALVAVAAWPGSSAPVASRETRPAAGEEADAPAADRAFRYASWDAADHVATPEAPDGEQRPEAKSLLGDDPMPFEQWERRDAVTKRQAELGQRFEGMEIVAPLVPKEEKK